jgi:hypothetical protein
MRKDVVLIPLFNKVKVVGFFLLDNLVGMIFEKGVESGPLGEDFVSVEREFVQNDVRYEGFTNLKFLRILMGVSVHFCIQLLEFLCVADEL